MPRKFWFSLACTLVLLAASACSPSPVSSGVASPADGCPTRSGDLELLLNSEEGYCLLYPGDYSLDAPRFIIINPAPGPGDVLGDAWASIELEAAAGRTAAQVAQARIAEVGPGFNIERTDLLVDGLPAVVVDGLPGPDSWRKVYIVSNERLYTLTFLPWAPDKDDPTHPTPLEALYTTMMDTLHFLPPTGPLPTATQ